MLVRTAPTTRFAAAPQAWALGIVVALLLAGGSLAAADPPEPAAENLADVPLHERDPFDRLTLTAEQGGASIDVLPLTAILPNRVVPPKERWPKEGVLKFRIVGKGTQDFEIAWIALEKIETYEMLLMAQAAKFVAEQKFDEALSYLELLQRKYPRTPGLAAALEEYYIGHARQVYLAYRRKEALANEALALIDEAVAANPGSAKAQGAMATVVDSLLKDYVDAGNFQAAREILARTTAKYGEAQKPVLDRWSAALAELAGAQMAAAREHLAGDRLREAHAAGRQMRQIWPTLPGGDALMAQISAKYPLVEVAVELLPPSDGRGNRLDHAGVARADRLTRPWLIEYTGYGPDGGDYRPALGTVAASDDGREVIVRLKRDQPFLAADLLSRFADPAALADPTDLPTWRRLIARLEVNDPWTVRAVLRQPHVRPQGFFEIPLAAPGEAPQSYVAADRGEAEARFILRPARPAVSPGEPREIAERRFADGRAAVRALERGEVDVVELAPLAHVPRLRENKAFVVEPYAVPALHVLAPNFRRALAGRRDFRRALEYAIDRAALLKTLLAGGDLPGCQVISGPFSPGTRLDDPLAAAYNPQVNPRPYEPRLAAALRAVAEAEVVKIAKATGQAEPKFGPLVLVHPGGDIPRAASRAIAAAWQTLGLVVETRELPADRVDDPTGDYDFRYAVLRPHDPVVDAQRLLGPGGLIGIDSPYLAQALRQVELAKSGVEARDRLRDVHRLAHEEVAVIALWQTIDFLVYRATLTGVGARPASLYQNIERWQVAAPGPLN